MNTGTNSSSGAAGGIATVAQRIRDRARQLESTRSDLSHLRRTVASARSAADAVRHLDEVRAARVRHLRKLAAGTAAAAEAAEEVAAESAALRAGMDQMASREEAEDEDVAALAMQIRATIRKKASLRGATEEARARGAAANDRMLAMERRVVEHSNNSAAASKAY